METPARRGVARASNGMVTSPHVLASEAGIDVLRAGGSAVDAATAASAVLAVVYPHMTSIGGDAFWLIHEGNGGSVKYLSGGGRAAASATIDWFTSAGLAEIPFCGVLPATLTVPGAVASWIEAHDKYGRLPLTKVLEVAISCAREGFAATGRLAAFALGARDELKKSSEAAAIFFIDGEPLKAGQRVVNSNLARSLDMIAREGREGFYAGPVAHEMTRFAEEHGGFFRLADFQAQKAKWGHPLIGTYRDVLIYNTPPPTQGFTVIQMLNLIERYDMGRIERLGPDYVHLLVQAKQIVYNDRDAVLADPEYAKVPIKKLLSKDYADARSKLIDTQAALAWDKVPSYGSLTGDTVYVAAVDRDGNAASLIQSLYGIFGSCVVAGNTGIVLQNRGAYFSLNPDHPNRLEPGKVPLHTLIASMAKRDGKLWSVFGCMGADGQPQIQLQAYVGMIDYGLNVQEAVDAPRFLSGRFALGEARDTLHIEARFPNTTLTELEHRGHILHRWADWNEHAGHAHGVIIESEMLMGGSDPRSDGAAIGY
jgi:gamma-glutamyltranspeptidase